MSTGSFIDSRQIQTGSEIDTELCIVGAGAAGITIAREFANRGVQVCLLESGGLNVDPDVSALGKIESVGRDYDVEFCRLRYFGGTANHWGGHCVPLEAIDFEKLDWIEYSGWPYNLAELLPYYKRAHDTLGLGDFNYDALAIAKELGLRTFPFNSTRVKTVVSRYNAVRFGLKYGDLLDRAENISVYLYADVSSIDLKPDGQSEVSGVTVKTLAGSKFSIRANHFVIAGGGIENARLLLLSNSARPAGLGNHSDLVGRFFQEHLMYSSGYILAKENHETLSFYGSEIPYGGIKVRGHIALPENQVRKLKIPKFRSEIHISSNLKRAAKRVKRGDLSIRDVLTLLESPVASQRGFFDNIWPEPNFYELNNYVQQVPNPNSRVTLSSQRDALGRNLSTLDWRLLPIDKEGIVKAHKLITEEVGRSEFGRMFIEMPDDEDKILDGAAGGNHHMGTTRMDKDPNFGVTDENAKVHFVDNLYVAGSSLFPTGGWSNPTLTIVATSIRLADHLYGKLRR